MAAEDGKQNNTIRGVLLLLAAVAAFSMMNAVAKLASAVHHPVDILFWRSFVPLLVIVAYLMTTRQFHLIKSKQPRYQAVRAAAGVLTMLSCFWAYTLLPLADTAALLFTSPVIVVFFVASSIEGKNGFFALHRCCHSVSRCNPNSTAGWRVI